MPNSYRQPDRKRAYNRAYNRSLIDLAAKHEEEFRQIFSDHYVAAVKEIEHDGAGNKRPGPNERPRVE